MSGAAVFGLCGGVLFGLCWTFAPHPLGMIVLWTFMSVHMTYGAWVCWRRTRLPLSTISIGAGAATFAAFALLAAAGHEFPDLPWPWWIAVGTMMAAGTLCLALESRVHPVQWNRWAVYVQRKSAWDIFTGRHIPNLRGPDA